MLNTSCDPQAFPEFYRENRYTIFSQKRYSILNDFSRCLAAYKKVE